MITGVVAIAFTVATGATEVASALPPPRKTIDGVVTTALPPPPQKATIQATYGAVTLDHANHLRMRVACRSCHTSGTIGSEVHLGAEVAHQTCKGCHRTEQRGPVACTGCHDHPVRAPELASKDAAATAAQPAAEKTAGDATPAARADGPGAATAGARAPEVTIAAVAPARPPEGEGSEPYKRITLEGGFTALQGTVQDPVVGPFLQLRTRLGSAVFSSGIELPGGMRSGRTIGLLGGGKAFPLAPRWNAMALGVLGFDIDNAALALFPMVGLRAGVEWTQYARTLNVFSLSITGARDFGGQRHQAAEMGTVWSLALSVGNEVTVARRASHDWW